MYQTTPGFPPPEPTTKHQVHVNMPPGEVPQIAMCGATFSDGGTSLLQVTYFANGDIGWKAGY
jgi:hypothetical protein